MIVHGGGKAAKINQRLAEAGLPPLTVEVGGPADGAGGDRLEPAARRLADRAPEPAPPLLPRLALGRLGRHRLLRLLPGMEGAHRPLQPLRRHKPFALTEWGVENGDDPSFVSSLFAWVKQHPRCKMLVYYQDFGSTSSYRIQNYPASLAVLKARLHSALFPPFAPDAPQLPPPPPGGVGRALAERPRVRPRSSLRRPSPHPHTWSCSPGSLALGAALRFSTLDLQSYRYDEAVTVGRVLQPSFFDTLVGGPAQRVDAAAVLRRSPGSGRGPSAPARSGCARSRLWRGPPRSRSSTSARVALPLPRRAGLIAAAIVAVSPVLIWFSQDARAYALVFLLTALSFLFFARARRRWRAVATSPAGRRSRRWRSRTHYFAGFVVVAEAVAAAARQTRPTS